MKTIAVASAKGGSGKSTITSLLAARASQDTPKVALIDLNFDQGSLTQWWSIRGEPDSPKLVSEDEVDRIPKRIKRLAAAGFRWCFIDTPPFDQDVIEQAISVSDAVVIPVKTSLFDVMSAEEVVEKCKKHRRPFSLLFNAMDNRFKLVGREAEIAFEDLGPRFKNTIGHRSSYILALSQGKTGAEIDKEARKETDALWGEIKLLAGIE